MIKNMSCGSIVVEFQGRQATIEGEALMPAPGLPSYIIYANSLTSWDAPNDAIPMSGTERLTILAGVQEELRRRGTPFEIEGDAEFISEETRIGSALAGSSCPRDGFWFTPARKGSRRYFKQGDVMLDTGSDYGTTVWQWDDDQS